MELIGESIPNFHSVICYSVMKIKILKIVLYMCIYIYIYIDCRGCNLVLKFFNHIYDKYVCDIVNI